MSCPHRPALLPFPPVDERQPVYTRYVPVDCHGYYVRHFGEVSVCGPRLVYVRSEGTGI